MRVKDARMVLLISGGVDSSVALYQMHKHHSHITAYFIKVWSEDDVHFSETCPWQDDLYYAQSVCNALKVPLRVISLQREYREMVIEHALSELKEGNTPSPDIFCNSMIKFGVFFKRIEQQVEYVISGHYARIQHHRDISYLLCARDTHKDQTYFLSHLKQEQLKKIITPIGKYPNKKYIRHIAQKAQLPTAGRPDSQGLCFLGTTRYRDFIAHYLSKKTGEIIDIDSGTVQGCHDGVWFYTIGQRKDLKLGGGPWYVAKKDTSKNILYITKNKTSLAKKTLLIENLLINIPRYEAKLHNANRLVCEVKIRHGAERAHASICQIEHNRYRVTLKSEVYAVAPGQRIALYMHQYCIGGGRIIA